MSGVLTRSGTYYISSEYETVFLHRHDNLMPPVVIGDFYGESSAALIDEAERWCVTVGCGAIVYYIEEPYPDYEYSRQPVAHWLNLYREPGNEFWFNTIEQLERDIVKLSASSEIGLSGSRLIAVPPFAAS